MQARKLTATLPISMITLSSSPSAVCSVLSETGAFDVFPDKPKKESWALLQNPEEELSSKNALSWPGEYDFAGITVRAIGQEEGRQVSYACLADGIRIAFVGAPILEWADSDLEKLGDIDVLVVPAEEPKKVLALVEAIDPRVIVLTEVKGGDLAGVAKACGIASIEPVKEFKVKPGSLPQDSRQVVVLK